MSRLEDYRGRHAGADIVVCGCGPSLHELERPGDHITIGVNDVGRRFQPNYLVVVNMPSQFAPGRFRHVAESQADALFTHLPLPVDHPEVVEFRLGRRSGVGVPEPGRLHYTRNSPYVAVGLAAHMGARRIGLIGVDFTDHHFFGETGRHPLTRHLAEIEREYGCLAAALRSRGVELVNLSSVSRLRSLPRVASFEPRRAAPSSRVSVLILARDEAETLPRAIGSVGELADEVVVGVDVATTDCTAEVARSAGAAVYPLRFDGDFARAHNELDGLASGDWAVKLDGHEHFAEGHASRLRAAIDEEQDGCGAIACSVEDVESSCRATAIRTYRRGPGVHYVGALHEQVVGWGERFRGRPDIVLRHEPATQRGPGKVAARIAALDRALAAEPADVSALFYRAQLHAEAGSIEAAVADAGGAWAQRAHARPVVRCLIAMLLARLDLRRGHWAMARRWRELALAERWDVPELYCLGAEIELGDPTGTTARAEGLLQLALRVPRAPWEMPVDERFHTWWPMVELARLAGERGDLEAQRRWTKRARECSHPGAPAS